MPTLPGPTVIDPAGVPVVPDGLLRYADFTFTEDRIGPVTYTAHLALEQGSTVTDVDLISAGDTSGAGTVQFTMSDGGGNHNYFTAYDALNNLFIKYAPTGGPPNDNSTGQCVQTLGGAGGVGDARYKALARASGGPGIYYPDNAPTLTMSLAFSAGGGAPFTFAIICRVWYVPPVTPTVATP